MYINPDWRILTVGDGDLSFSASLLKHYQPAHLTATAFDQQAVLTAKYGSKYIDELTQQGCQILTGFDVTDCQSWGGLKQHDADVVIFQFPLVPAFSSFAQYQQQCANSSVNMLNRFLLRRYLLHCFEFFLAENGANLAFITSKEVKPYSHWNVEEAIIKKTAINYIGKMPFDIAKFPDYKIRNVDRDKHVKSTTSYTYVYSSKPYQEIDTTKLNIAPYIRQNNYCALCKVGPFSNEIDKKNHENSKKHQQMLAFDTEWSLFLASD